LQLLYLKNNNIKAFKNLKYSLWQCILNFDSSTEKCVNPKTLPTPWRDSNPGSSAMEADAMTTMPRHQRQVFKTRVSTNFAYKTGLRAFPVFFAIKLVTLVRSNNKEICIHRQSFQGTLAPNRVAGCVQSLLCWHQFMNEFLPTFFTVCREAELLGFRSLCVV
jgi:hypothetical protein